MAIGPHRPPPPSLASLRAAEAPPSLFLDFDGTLVELAPAPDAIDVPNSLANALERLLATLGGRLALVSGRSPADLLGHLGPIRVPLAGSHGAALLDADGDVLGQVPQPLPDAAAARLAQAAREHRLRYETKSHGGALHWRENPQGETTAVTLVETLAREFGLEVKRGKSVAELVWPGANKGSALRTFMDLEPFSGSRPVFIGDDVTDEDGFVAAARYGGIGIAVGERASDAAQFHLKDVAAVHQWLFL